MVLGTWWGCHRQTAPAHHRMVVQCSLARERVKGGLTTNFLKSRLDVGVDEGDRIIRVLVVRGQIMEHVKQLRASRGTIL